MPHDQILTDFKNLAQRAAGQPLAVAPCGRVTVGELADLADLAARAWAPRRLAPGTLVGLAAGGVGFLAAYLALRQLGAVPVLLDVKAPAAERGRVAFTLGCAGCVEAPAWPRGAADLQWELVGRNPSWVDPGIGAVKLSSGSTGEPRGILVTSEALAADDTALAATMGLRADDRFLAAIPLSHSYGFASLALPALRRGSLLVMPAEPASPYGPLHVAREFGATVFPTTPSYLDALLRHTQPPPWPESLRLTLTAGAPLGVATAERFHAAYGRWVHVFYGASETGGICFDREGSAGARGTVGAPVEGVRVWLEPLQEDGQDEGGAAGCGVVTVESPAMAAGYLPEDPSAALAAGRFQSGDLARWQGGELQLAGRLDDLINIRGKKVNPREVEAVVAALPGVDDVIVFGTHTARREETVRAVVACRGQQLVVADVIAWCRPRLAEHKVPRSVLMVAALPRTARGKVDRAAVRAMIDPREAVPPVRE